MREHALPVLLCASRQRGQGRHSAGKVTGFRLDRGDVDAYWNSPAVPVQADGVVLRWSSAGDQCRPGLFEVVDAVGDQLQQQPARISNQRQPNMVSAAEFHTWIHPWASRIMVA